VTEGERSGEPLPREPSWGEKARSLHEALAHREIPYAFGGAIALNYHREPRSTLDIDVNVFVAPEHQADVVRVLADVYDVPDPERLATELQEQGQARTLWGTTYIDVFLANTDFHASMAERIERQPFGDAEIPVLAIEDLLVCKVLYDRPKDWVDIDAVAHARRGELDRAYIQTWLAQFLPDDDPRLGRIDDVLR